MASVKLNFGKQLFENSYFYKKSRFMFEEAFMDDSTNSDTISSNIKNIADMVSQESISSCEQTETKFDIINDSIDGRECGASGFWHAHVYHKKTKLTPFFIADIIGDAVNSKDAPLNLSSLLQSAKKTSINSSLEKTDKTNTKLIPNVPNFVNEPLNLTTNKEKKRVLDQKGR